MYIPHFESEICSSLRYVRGTRRVLLTRTNQGHPHCRRQSRREAGECKDDQSVSSSKYTNKHYPVIHGFFCVIMPDLIADITTPANYMVSCIRQSANRMCQGMVGVTSRRLNCVTLLAALRRCGELNAVCVADRNH